MSYKSWINCHFAGCRLLANAHDEHRNRAVQVFMLPGHFDHVGVTDGTDAWIAPVIADPFSVNVKRILDDIQAGKDPRVESKGRQRVRLVGLAEALIQESPKLRKRIVLRSPA